MHTAITSHSAGGMQTAITSQSAGGASTTPRPKKFITKVNAIKANAGSTSKPIGASSIPVSEGAITILSLVIEGLVVGVALQGTPLFAMRPFFCNNMDDVDPIKVFASLVWLVIEC